MGRKNAAKKAASAVADKARPTKQQAPPPANLAFPAEFQQVFKLLGSLQVAIALLSLTVVILALGTMLESWYSAKLAQELIYRTWWFTGLLGLLGVNIFFAAVKKWPWKKHQIGFLITHVGLLLLLAGGVMNAVGGVDAQMGMVDTADRAALERVQAALGPYGNRSSQIFYQQETLLTVSKAGSKEKISYDYQPGTLPWGDTAYDTVTPAWIYAMDRVAHPWPRGFRKEIDKDVYLEVTAYYPHCEEDEFSPAARGDLSFPALQYRLSSPHFGAMPSSWLALNPRDVQQAIQPQGGGIVEFLGPCPDAMLDEFKKPPADADRGAQGQLVIRKGGALLRLDVAKQMGTKTPLGNTGWQVQLNRFVPGLRLQNKANIETAADPAVEFTFIRPDGKPLPYVATARITSDAGPVAAADGKTAPPDPEAPAFWYHPADWKLGAADQKGALHFVVSDSTNQLHFRTFSSKEGPMKLEQAGEIEPGQDEYDIWGAMNFKLQVRKFLPRAKEEVSFTPTAVRPGLERKQNFDPLNAVIRCELSTTKRNARGEPQVFRKEFQVREDSARAVTLEGTLDGAPFKESYQIGLATRREELPFNLRLIRAEQQVDRGSNRPATFTSFVQLTDPAEGIKNENHVITMNEPLEHRGYKFYQSNYTPLMQDATGKPVNLSGFTVGRDPGLGLKYLGSMMLALGIFLMFTMKAYSIETMRRAFADRLGHGVAPRTTTAPEASA